VVIGNGMVGRRCVEAAVDLTFDPLDPAARSGAPATGRTIAHTTRGLATGSGPFVPPARGTDMG
jgi:NAD(P)H-nitrite reductase large subunit